MLKALYIIAIGLLFSGFVGFGVATFYPTPVAPVCQNPPPGEPVMEKSGSLAAQQTACDKKFAAFEIVQTSYSRNLSIAYLIIAVAVIALSLFGLGKVTVIGDGITLGGILILFISLASSFHTGNQMLQFFTVTLGLAIVIFLSYWKFIRKQK